MDSVSPKTVPAEPASAPEPCISLENPPGTSTPGSDGYPPLPETPPTPPEQDYDPAPEKYNEPKEGPYNNDRRSQQKPPLHVNTTPPTPHPPHAHPWHPLSQVHHIAPFTPISPPPTAQRTSLDDLHNERTYLLQNLQRQGERATRLLERYATLEARLSAPTPPNGTSKPPSSRKTRKELATLKGRLAESSRQEHLMLLRLGEIWLEVRNRERWLAVAGHMPQRAHGGVEIPPTPATAVSAVSAASTEYFACSSALSPLSPDFVPGRPFSKQDMWGRTIHEDEDAEGAKKSTHEGDDRGQGIRGGGDAAEGGEAQEDSIYMMEREEAGNDKEDQTDREVDTGTKSVMFKEVIWEIDDEDANTSVKHLPTKGRRSISLHLPFALGARDKRMSLPSLKTIWRLGAGVELDQDEDEQFLGPLCH
ncbi:hypothetical protein QBC34DRAFT_157889 [Podospora aff. communis PSN243]|uniref:Uncharacterized protein n=1 Tax=Podospora aff. communis PSN243 TaxID=3040156 RepID=A0AAV9GZD9_9PEZI|nr:hypothetical protein QBC34DRAFT_157889 [Podospora aff. communis PSN243]